MAEPLYNTDFYRWTQQQAQLIRSGNLEALDLDNILEELEGMGRSERRQLGHRLDVLLMHLLKWHFQPEHRSSSWEGTIKEQRFRIARLLKANPSLKSDIPDIMLEAYQASRITAFKETGIEVDAFPEVCLWSFAEVTDNAFWP